MFLIRYRRLPPREKVNTNELLKHFGCSPAPVSSDARVEEPSDDERFASAVAAFAEALRGSSNADAETYDALLRRIREAKGSKQASRWDELIGLVEAAAKAARSKAAASSAATDEAVPDDETD